MHRRALPGAPRDGGAARGAVCRRRRDREPEVCPRRAVTLDENLEGVGAPFLETPDESFIRVGRVHRFERYSDGGPAVSVTTTRANFLVQGRRCATSVFARFRIFTVTRPVGRSMLHPPRPDFPGAPSCAPTRLP